MQYRGRKASATLEFAVVFPVLLFLLLALIVGGMGVFHYQQVAALAQEACRYSCVRGAEFQKDSNQPSPTQEQVLQQSISPLAVGMDSSGLLLHLQWIDQGLNAVQDWDGAPKTVKSLNKQGEYVTNTVRATVTYTWSPGILIGSLTLTSTYEIPMSE